MRTQLRTNGIPIGFIQAVQVFTVFAYLWGGAMVYGESRFEKWKKDHPFTIGVMYYDLAFGPDWYRDPTPDLVIDPNLDLLKRSGINLLNEVSHSSSGHSEYPGVRAAHKAKISYMSLGAGWSGLENFQQRARWWVGDEKYAGVQIADEPYDKKEQLLYADQTKWLRDDHPDKLSLFCMQITDQPKWQQMWEVIRTDGIIFQWYPYYTSNGKSLDLAPYAYGMLGFCVKFCKNKEIGFFVARGVGGPPRSDSSLRLNTYAALAYGCDGFIDWRWGTTTKESGYAWYKDKKYQGPGGHFESLAKINVEVANLGPALTRLKYVQTYHANLAANSWAGPVMGFAEKDGRRTGRLTAISGSTYPFNNHLMAGFFRDNNDEEYFMVVNKINSRARDVDEKVLATNVTLTFANSVTAVERLSRETGTIETLEVVDGKLTFTLPAGTGDLFKYATGKPFSGVTDVTSKVE